MISRLLNLSTRVALLGLALGACSHRRPAPITAALSPSRVDRQYRTLADRAHTGIGGSSMGGLIAIHAGLTRPDIEGAAHNEKAWASRLPGAVQWLYQ